jgi:hypothetical protein
MTDTLKEVIRNLIGRRKGGAGQGGTIETLKAGMKYRASIV